MLKRSRVVQRALCVVAAVLAGCEALSPERGIEIAGRGDALPSAHAPGPDATRSAGEPAQRLEQEGISDPPPSNAEFIEFGTDEFVNPVSPGGQSPSADGAITLNFQDTALTEVVKVILGDLLARNYFVDPSVNGRVTLQTSRPLSRKDLVPTLETLLRMNGAAVVLNRGAFHVVPREGALRGLIAPQLGDSDVPLPQGYSVRVVPVRYVSAREMAEILEPFAPVGGMVRVDTARNLLVLAGSAAELSGLVDTVRIFDVDWLKGLSFGLFTPEFVDASVLAKQLAGVFGEEGQGPLAGLVRIVPIDHLESLLVVSPRREYMDRVAQWIERLDRPPRTAGQRLFVYRVRNGRASDLAGLLEQVFEPRAGEGEMSPAELAPGLDPVEIRTATGEDEEPWALLRLRNRRRSVPGDGLLTGGGAAIRVIADDINNSLLILANAAQHREIEAALAKLDIVPLQVLIEATIAEVSLTDDLSLGVEWFFDNHLGRRTGDAVLDLGAASLAPGLGFSYVIRSAGDVRFVLNALASASRLNIVSSPSLMVLNNREASIQVGDQVPVTTRQQQTTETDATLVNNIEFRDTGVLLTVKPRVNAGGLVVMEVAQEVSDVAPGSTGSLTPTIQQRRINSTVAVQSGETVVLGGLIRENKNLSESAVPGLSRIPGLGWLFGSETDSARRTELVVLITPRAVRDAGAARRITEEFRRKMRGLKPFDTAPATEASPGAAPGAAAHPADPADPAHPAEPS